jgi:hypothetical protein
MRNKNRERLLRATVAVILVLSVCAVIPAMGNGEPTVTRLIVPSTVSPGDDFSVTVMFTAPENINNATIIDKLEALGDWNITVESAPPIWFVINNVVMAVWTNSTNSGVVMYRLTAPSDAAGNYYFRGELKWDGGTRNITGNDHVTVRAPDTEPPVVTNPNANPAVIPEDTDNEPRWGELANLSVVVTDESGIASVTINLSSIGGSAVQPMARIGASNVWNVSRNASVGSARFDGGGYMPHLLRVNATDEHGNSNTSMSIELMVMRNGDVDRDGSVTYSDAMYLYKWKAGKPGFGTIYETVADVDGDGSVTYSDAMYLYKWKAGKPGFGVFH